MFIGPPVVSAADKVAAAYAAISPDQLTLMTAAKARLFEKYDLDVKVIYIGGSTAVVQAMVAGDVQIAHIGGSGIVNARAGGIDLVYIAGLVNTMTAQIISRPEIKNVSDLKGKTLGVTRRGSNSDFWSRLALSQSGLVPEKDAKFLYTGGLPATFSMLQQGLVAAGTSSLAHPLSNALIKQGFNVLIDLSKLGAESPTAGIATTRRYLQANRPLLVKYMKACLEAIKLNFSDKAFAKKVIAEVIGAKDENLIEESYNVFVLSSTNKIPYPVAKGWPELIDFTARQNPRVKEIKLEEVLDDSIIRELDESGFIKSIGLK